MLRRRLTGPSSTGGTRWRRLGRKVTVKTIVQEGEVEKDWATFLEHIDVMYRRAVQEVLRIERQTLNDPNGTEQAHDEARLRIQRAEAQIRDTKVKGMMIEMVKIQENMKHRMVEDKTMARTNMQKRLGRLIKLRALVREESWPVMSDERNKREINNLLNKVCVRVREATTREKADGGQSALAQAEWASTRLPEGASTREEVCEQIRQFWKDVWAPSEVSEAQAQLDLQEALLPCCKEEKEWEDGLSRGGQSPRCPMRLRCYRQVL